ncbi:MAG: SRPBCC family protein [Ignavibacteriales bacterium]|nr:MAG: SRPBCC family protein [Ignavibacteriales bacterium]
MATIKDEIMINAPANFVFGFISDYSNDVKWREGVIDMKCSTRDNIFIGTRTRETMKMLGRNFITVARVTEYSPYNRIAFRSVVSEVPVNGYRELKDVNGSTNFTYSLSLELRGVYKLFSPFIVSMYSKRVKRDLEKLKMILDEEYVYKVRQYTEYKIPFGFYS